MNVAVIGASSNPERISYLAVRRLLEDGHRVFPVHPKEKKILGQKAYASIKNIEDKIDTVSLYVGPEISNQIMNEVISAFPKRIIFNPGAENEAFKEKAEQKGIHTENACTLVLLSTGKF